MNITSNMLVILTNMAVGVWMTPYLINHLGLKVYGMIPLVMSFIQYFRIFTTSIANAVTRYVSIYLNKGEVEKGNIYFNSALTALFILCGILLIPIAALSFYFSDIFQVPAGFEAATERLFFIVILTSFITVTSACFYVSPFTMHRFDLYNSILILGKFLQVLIMVLCFTYATPALEYFGLSYFSMAGLILVSLIILSRHLTPELQIRLNLFDRTAVRDMGHMSMWVIINQTGAILYMSVSFIVINLFLGPEANGRFGPIAQIVMLLITFGGTISNTFSPIVYDYIAHDKKDALAIQISRSTKYMGLVIAFPVGLLCGLATPLLERWLGPSFSDLGPMVWLMLGSWLATLTTKPMFEVFKGFERVKIPAIVTLFVGILNVCFSIILIYYTNLGIYGIAISLLFCLTGKNLFFTPIYTASLVGQPKMAFIKQTVPGMLTAAILLMVGLVLSLKYNLASIGGLLIAGMIISLVYILLCYFVFLNKNDKVFLWSLVLPKN